MNEIFIASQPKNTGETYRSPIETNKIKKRKKVMITLFQFQHCVSTQDNTWKLLAIALIITNVRVTEWKRKNARKEKFSTLSVEDVTHLKTPHSAHVSV